MNQAKTTKTTKKQRDIFASVPNYAAGFHSNNDAKANAIYDAKTEELKAKISADLIHAPEIIVEAFRACEVLKYRRAFTTGSFCDDEYNATYKAIENMADALAWEKALADIEEA